MVVAQQVEQRRTPEHAGRFFLGEPILDLGFEPPAETDLIPIRAQPFPQFGPVLEQSFVADLDRTGTFAGRGEGDQALFRSCEHVEHALHVARLLTPCDQIGDQGAASRVFGAFAEADHGEEGAPGDRFLWLAQAVIQALRLARDSSADTAQPVHGLGRGGALSKAVPDPGEDEFEERQGTLAASRLLDQELDRTWGDPPAPPPSLVR